MIRLHVIQLSLQRADRVFPITGFSHSPNRSFPRPSTIRPTNYAPQRSYRLLEVNPYPRCEPKRLISPQEVNPELYAVFRDLPQPSPPVSRE